jgi:hypothetical protein
MSDRLNVIYLDFTSVDMQALILLLDALPNLQILDHQALLIAIQKFSLSQQGKSLKIKQLKLQLSHVSVEELCNIVFTCPDLVDLSLLPFSGNADALLPLLDVKKVVRFASVSSIIPDPAWFIHKGEHLTKLEITGNISDTQVDMTLLGQFCTNLQTVVLHEVLLVESKNPELSKEAFSQLLSVSLQNRVLCNNIASSLELIVRNAHALNNFELFLFRVSDGFFESVFMDSESNGMIFSQLNSITFGKCKNLSDSSFNAIICCSPHLTEIHLHENANSYFIDNLIAHNKLGVQVFCDKTVEDSY